jgi:hypothetical protein
MAPISEEAGNEAEPAPEERPKTAVPDWATSLAAEQAKCTGDLTNLIYNLRVIQSISAAGMPETWSSEESLEKLVQNVGRQSTPSRLGRPSDALSSRIIANECDGGNFGPPRMLASGKPPTVFTTEVGVDTAWTRDHWQSFPGCQEMVKAYEGDAIGLSKVGFEGLVNILIEEKQWVRFAGMLGNTGTEFKQSFAGPHGPLYIFLHPNWKGDGETTILTPAQWAAVIMPQKYKDVLLKVIQVAIDKKLMREGTQLSADAQYGHTLKYPVYGGVAGDVRIGSYEEAAAFLKDHPGFR